MTVAIVVVVITVPVCIFGDYFQLNWTKPYDMDHDLQRSIIDMLRAAGLHDVGC